MNRKNIFSSENKAMAFVFEEVILAVIIVYQIYHMVGAKFIGKELFFFQNPITIMNIFFFIIIIIIFAILYFAIAVRDKLVMKAHEEFGRIVFGTAREKIFGIDREVITLYFFELIFALIIALIIYIYLDPDVSVEGFNKVPFPFNLIAFVVFIAIGLYIFSNTKAFRDNTYKGGIIQRVLFSNAKQTTVRRITNKGTGSIRVRNAKRTFTRRR